MSPNDTDSTVTDGAACSGWALPAPRTVLASAAMVATCRDVVLGQGSQPIADALGDGRVVDALACGGGVKRQRVAPAAAEVLLDHPSGL